MHVQSIWNDFLSLIYPKLCLGCESPLPKGSKYICPKCHYNLPKTNNYKLSENIFKQKFEGIVPVDQVLVYAYFVKGGIMQQVLHELKYNDNQEIGEMFGRWFGHDLLLGGFADRFDVIVPVPLHPKKLQKRGFNQAAAFGRGLAEVLKAEQQEQALVKTKNIDSQTKKAKVSRIKRVEGIFEWNPEINLAGKSVLLVDDVLTTGSTLIASAEPLLKAEPKELSIAVMAGVP